MSLNFGKYSLKFNNNNQDADHPNWDITFDNINTNADTFDGHQYSPIYFGSAWAGAGDNAAVSEENQKNIKVTFNNVNANVTDRPIISGFKTNWAGSADINGEAYTLVLKGTNNLTSNGYTGGFPPLVMMEMLFLQVTLLLKMALLPLICHKHHHITCNMVVLLFVLRKMMFLKIM